MESEIAIDIAAPPSLVFALARDVERWSTLLPHYARSTVVDRGADGAIAVDFIARRPLLPALGLALPVAWRARTWNDPTAIRLRFRHIAGATRGMDVTWRIEPGTEGCRVVIEHRFESRLPGFAAFVDRAFTRPIARRTLVTFKALAESVQSTLAAPANPAT